MILQFLPFIKNSSSMINDALEIASKIPEPDQRCASFLSLLSSCKFNKDQLKMIWERCKDVDEKNLNIFIRLLISISNGLNEEESSWFFQEAKKISVSGCDYSWKPFPEEKVAKP